MVMHRKRKKSYRVNGNLTEEPNITNGKTDCLDSTGSHNSISGDITQDFARIVSVRSLAPTAEAEQYEEQPWRRNCETVIEMGEEEDEEILGLEYPHERSTFSAHDLDVGHFLCGGNGLDAFALENITFPEVEFPLLRTGSPLQQQPALASCSTVWDNLVHLCAHCAKRANSKCADCLDAFYCGDEHQRLDWDNHRPNCCMYTRSIPNPDCDGREVLDGMVARMGIMQGQELFSEKPVLLFPLVSWKGFEHPLDCFGLDRYSFCKEFEPACLGCNKAIDFVGPTRHRCSTCSLPLCSKGCEYEVPHKLGECEAIQEAGLKRFLVGERNPQSPCYHALYMDVEILRALRLREVEGTQFHNLLKLQYNSRTKTYTDGTHFKHFQRDVRRIAPLSIEYAKENVSIVVLLHAVISSNSVRPSLGSMFKVIFRRQAEFTHSCLPNTVHYVEHEQTRDQLKMRLVTKAAVPIFADEMISIDFLPTPYLPHAQRQSLLHHMGISCVCPRCTKPHELNDFSIEFKCRSCIAGYVRPEDPLKGSQGVWACGHCFEETPFASMDRVESELSLELVNLPKREYDDVPGLYKFIQSSLDTLHRGHALIIHTWCCIESLLRKRMEAIREVKPEQRYDERTLNDCTLLLQYSDTVLPHLEAIRQGLWVDKGLVLFHKFHAKFILACEDFLVGRTNLKDFTRNIFQCLKILDLCLQSLTPFERMRASNKSITKTIQDASTAMSSLKDYAATLIDRQKGTSKSNRNPFTSSI